MTVRSWGMLLPAGPNLKARDGREWTYDATEILAAFDANKGPLAVDYEHGQDVVAKGEAAPAAGWITQMQVRDGAIWGDIEWTGKAAAYIADGAYRYLSSSMRLHGSRVVALLGAGLVNRPALHVEALTIPTEGDIAREATALAGHARNYQSEQAALGRKMTISEAVMSVRERRL